MNTRNYINTWTLHKIWTLHKYLNIASTPEYWIVSWILHKHTNVASTPEHCINTSTPKHFSTTIQSVNKWTIHQHPSIASTPEYCINTQTLRQQLKIASTPKQCIKPIKPGRIGVKWYQILSRIRFKRFLRFTLWVKQLMFSGLNWVLAPSYLSSRGCFCNKKKC